MMKHYFLLFTISLITTSLQCIAPRHLMSINKACEILECSQNDSKEDIEKAYRKKMRDWHPDRNKSEEAEEKTKLINQAKDRLIKYRNTPDRPQASYNQEDFFYQNPYYQYYNEQYEQRNFIYLFSKENIESLRSGNKELDKKIQAMFKKVKEVVPYLDEEKIIKAFYSFQVTTLKHLLLVNDMKKSVTKSQDDQALVEDITNKAYKKFESLMQEVVGHNEYMEEITIKHYSKKLQELEIVAKNLENDFRKIMNNVKKKKQYTDLLIMLPLIALFSSLMVLVYTANKKKKGTKN